MNDRKLGLIAALSCTLLLLVANGVEQFSTPLSINWDNSMYLQYAQLLLQGQTPFVDFTDVNPPLIIYLSVLPVFISNLVNVHVIIIAKWVMLALEFASCGLSAALLWRSLQSPAERIYAGVFITILATFNSFLGIEYGEREHLFVLFYMPFLLTRWRRYNGHPANRSLSIATGIFGAIGLCFKPYFLFIPLMTELWWLFSTKRFRLLLSPENIAAAATGTIYGAHFIFFPNAQKSAFLEIALNQWLYTKVWGIPVVHAILLYGPFFPLSGYFLLLTSVLAGFLYRRNSLILPMAFYCWGSYFACVIQQKFWTYYKIPLYAGLLILLGLQLVALAQVVASRIENNGQIGLRIVRFLRFCALGAAYVACLYLLVDNAPRLALFGKANQFEIPGHGEPSKQLKEEWRRLATINTAIDPFLDHSKINDRIMVLSSILFPAYPAFVQLGRLPGSRYPYCFPIIEYNEGKALGTALGNAAMSSQYEAKVTAALNNILEDERHYKPRLILTSFIKDPAAGIRLQDKLYWDGVSLPWFRQKLLENYKYVQTFQYEERTFEIYQRKD